ncbi:MAG TPA: hypothetical protein VG841_07105 [Caulobacterales bacterium]|nr:hypothetical protein [Caulobacterales bacterium]
MTDKPALERFNAPVAVRLALLWATALIVWFALRWPRRSLA